MTPDDIPDGLALCRSAGWNQLESDWELFLHTSPDGCRVAIDENEKVIATVTTINYEKHFSWIGMVLVDSARKRQGIGTRLLHEAFEILDQEQNIKLDATPAGREVYLKLNFVDEYRLSRMYNNAVPAGSLTSSSVRQVTENDFPSLLKLDREVFGADRKTVLEWIWKRAPQLAYVTEINNHISGYCFGRNGYNYTHIGPVIAENREDAKQVVSAVLANCAGRPVIIDANHDSDWLQWLSSIGFAEQRQFIRMYRGVNSWPGIPGKQFAILGPEFG
jgi:ribosomal protein S18 acetylase RimI-like enzyme